MFSSIFFFLFHEFLVVAFWLEIKLIKQLVWVELTPANLMQIEKKELFMNN